MSKRKPKAGDAALIDGREATVDCVKKNADGVEVVRFVDADGTVDRARLDLAYHIEAADAWTITGRLVSAGTRKEFRVTRRAGEPFDRRREIAAFLATREG